MELIRLIFTIWESNGVDTILKKIHFISPKNPCEKKKQPELKPNNMQFYNLGHPRSVFALLDLMFK